MTLSLSLSSSSRFWRQRSTGDDDLWLQLPGLEPVLTHQGWMWVVENSIKAWPALQVYYRNTNYSGRGALGNKTQNKSAEILGVKGGKDWRGGSRLCTWRQWEVDIGEWNLKWISRVFEGLRCQQNGQNRWDLESKVRVQSLSLHSLTPTLPCPTSMSRTFLQSDFYSPSCRIFIPFLSLLEKKVTSSS